MNNTKRNTNLTLLIVHERSQEREILREIFRTQYEILEAETGKQALDSLKSCAVGIVLTAIKLHDMEISTLLRSLQKEEQYNEIPVVAIIDREDLGRGIRAMDIGAADFITKPYHTKLARQRIENVLIRRENEWRKAKQAAQDIQIQEMYRHIETDPVTGIYNRDAFNRRAAALLQENPEEPYSILYLDISSFKIVNDIFDVETGTRILQKAADYFHKTTEGIGLCARLQADHFVLCIPDAAYREKEFLSGLDRAVQSTGIPHKINFFAGRYPVEQIDIPIDQMCDRAHMALNRVKGSALKRTAVYDASMREQLILEQKITRDLPAALKEKQFFIVLQPIYSVATGKAIGAEALVRWNHPNEGFISPGQFVPVLERNGSITKLDRFVWEEVCRFLKTRQDQGAPALPVSVNVSRLNFYHENLVETFLNLTRKYNLPTSLLKLELTESAYTEDPERIISCIRELRALGYPILMDDFGSGYSSLNMLKNLPVDILKIDMGFLQDFESIPRTGQIVKFVVDLARSLNTDVVVEGVETKAQIDFLTTLGCDQIQGYYYSRPLPLPDFIALLDAEQKGNTK